MSTQTDEKWTGAARRTVREFKAWMDKRGMSRVQVAKLLGVSRPTLSPMLSEKYTGDVAAICASMERILRRARLREVAPERPPYATTSVTEQVYRACSIAHIERVICLIMGPSGIGKTIGLKRYCEQEPDAVYVVAGVSSTPWSCMRLVAQAIAVPYQCTARQLRADLAAALRDSSILLILDEMDYTPEETLQALRMIHDEADVGMVWSGTTALMDHVRGRGSPTLRQVLRRIRYAAYLQRCSDDDLGRILAYYELSEDSARAVIAGAGGEADRAVSAVVSARRTVGERGEITPAEVARAYDTLALKIGDLA